MERCDGQSSQGRQEGDTFGQVGEIVSRRVIRLVAMGS